MVRTFDALECGSLLPLRGPDQSGSKLPHSRKASHAHHLASAYLIFTDKSII
jgi:hypothetical protein